MKKFLVISLLGDINALFDLAFLTRKRVCNICCFSTNFELKLKNEIYKIIPLMIYRHL